VVVVDANVLLYAVNEDASLHLAARTWLESALRGNEPVAFSWVALLAFLRLATRAAVFPTPLSVDEAFTVVEWWLAQPPAVTLEPTRRHVGLLRGLVSDAGTAGNLVTDAHLAALALEHGARVVSFDRDFARFANLRWSMPS
jgi:uncharacterized protein